MTKRKIIAELNKIQDRMAKERDNLRTLFSEIEDLTDISSDAIDNIEYAIDRLSETL